MSSKLVDYADSSEDDEQKDPVFEPPKKPEKFQTNLSMIVAAPAIDPTMTKYTTNTTIDPYKTKELTYNPKYQDLYAPVMGPVNPKKASDYDASGQFQGVDKNFLAGRIESAYMSDAQFDIQMRQFHAKGFAANPTEGAGVDATVSRNSSSLAPIITETSSNDNNSKNNKRKRLRNDDAGDIDGYRGPWAEYEGENRIAKPTEEQQKLLEEFNAKKKSVDPRSAKREQDEEAFQDRCTLHIQDPYDYQGRSFLHPPHDLDVPIHKADHVPNRCFLPKKLLHTWAGHSKAVTCIKLFPVSGHLLASGSQDGKVKLWEVYHERRNVITYLGHKQAIRDLCFNKHGDKFVSAGYDRFLKLWDTETGQCVKRFPNRKMAYCVKFNNADGNQHLFLTGNSDKKILCWDTRTGKVCQEYDRHLGAVNTVTIVDSGRRFVSTSDDKSLRVWDWDIPVDIKYIADPTMHAIPAVAESPNGKFLACQFMDNKIQAFALMNRFKLQQKKTFQGHIVASYACQPAFSPDMSYLISGDAEGKCFIWDWKTTKLLSSFQAHENVCIAALWHPHETSKVITAGWDNTVKLWD